MIHLYDILPRMPRYLDTINSDTGELNTISALNLIVFGAKLEHLDLIEYVVVDLLKVKWSSFIRREFFKQMFIFLVFFILGMFCFVVRPYPQGTCKLDLGNSTDFENDTTTTPSTTTTTMTEIISGLVTGMPMLANETNQTSSEDSLVTSCSEGEGDLVIDTGLGSCYLHVMDTPVDKLRMAGEVVLVVMAVYFILKVYITYNLTQVKVTVCIDLINHNDDHMSQAVHEFTFLGWRVFMQNMVLCPSRVAFLISCVLVQVNQASGME